MVLSLYVLYVQQLLRYERATLVFNHINLCCVMFKLTYDGTDNKGL